MCLDLGLGKTGVAIWDDESEKFIFGGVIFSEVQEGLSVAQSNIFRCRFLVSRLKLLAQKYNVIRIVAEFPHGGSKSAKAMRAMAMSLACLASFAELSKLPLFSVTPDEVKRMVCPEREEVSKEMVQAYAKARFSDRLLPKQKALREHVADAMVCIDVYLLRK